MSALFAWLKLHRLGTTLFVVMAVCAAFYVQWQTAATAAARAATDRETLIGAADRICEAVNMPFRPDGVKRPQWGVACLNEARRVGRIESDLNAGTADALLQGLDARMGREAADALLAAAYAKRAAEAVEDLEKANAAVEGDVATGAWAGAINDAAGLRNGG